MLPHIQFRETVQTIEKLPHMQFRETGYLEEILCNFSFVKLLLVKNINTNVFYANANAN